jgi:hypothetical protein
VAQVVDAYRARWVIEEYFKHSRPDAPFNCASSRATRAWPWCSPSWRQSPGDFYSCVPYPKLKPSCPRTRFSTPCSFEYCAIKLATPFPRTPPSPTLASQLPGSVDSSSTTNGPDGRCSVEDYTTSCSWKKGLPLSLQ